jgi:hypothetical protein
MVPFPRNREAMHSKFEMQIDYPVKIFAVVHQLQKNCDIVPENWSLLFPFTFLLTYLIRSSYTLQCRGLFFHFDHFTDGRTPWTSDQPVARPLPNHRTTQTQNKHIHIPNTHALCGIRTKDPRPPGERGQFMP